MKRFAHLFFSAALMLCLQACELLDFGPDYNSTTEDKEENDDSEEMSVSLMDVAQLLSSVNIGQEQLREVHEAVSSSSGNGYDEEYTMKNLFASPGTGVGEDKIMTKGDGSYVSAGTKAYSTPLRALLEERIRANATRAGGDVGLSAEEYLDCLQKSDMQIYWPYSDNWDGSSTPIITYDPLTEASANLGYYADPSGNIKEITVTEEIAKKRPVWVVNRNQDAGYESMDVIRKNHPEWEEGGNVVVRTSASGSKALILKDFTMNRQYDSWFAGASEFFVKIGAVESFTASTESEMYLYNPSITDFLVVVKRGQIGLKQKVNTVLVSEWTDQLDNCALMIIEDDGGTRTTWSCTAVVKYNSKSYGFELSIPYNSRDDIVWRGQLSHKYIESKSDVTSHFGDVMLTFSIKSY